MRVVPRKGGFQQQVVLQKAIRQPVVEGTLYLLHVNEPLAPLLPTGAVLVHLS